MRTLTDADLRRYYAKVQINSTGCLLTWAAGKCGGYGVLGFGGRDAEKAHRLAAQIAGMDPTGRVVMHACDNPPCVTPDHLSVGTQAENMDDRASKGRTARLFGRSNGNHRSRRSA